MIQSVRLKSFQIKVVNPNKFGTNFHFLQLSSLCPTSYSGPHFSLLFLSNSSSFFFSLLTFLLNLIAYLFLTELTPSPKIKLEEERKQEWYKSWTRKWIGERGRERGRAKERDLKGETFVSSRNEMLCLNYNSTNTFLPLYFAPYILFLLSSFLLFSFLFLHLSFSLFCSFSLFPFPLHFLASFFLAVPFLLSLIQHSSCCFLTTWLGNDSNPGMRQVSGFCLYQNKKIQEGEKKEGKKKIKVFSSSFQLKQMCERSNCLTICFFFSFSSDLQSCFFPYLSESFWKCQTENACTKRREREGRKERKRHVHTSEDFRGRQVISWQSAPTSLPLPLFRLCFNFIQTHPESLIILSSFSLFILSFSNLVSYSNREQKKELMLFFFS